jgi:hypothetical protein
MADPAATVYLTDHTRGGPAVPLDLTAGLPAAAAQFDAVATFADRRPDRHLSAGEIAVLAYLVPGSPTPAGTPTAGGPGRPAQGPAGSPAPPPPTAPPQ